MSLAPGLSSTDDLPLFFVLGVLECIDRRPLKQTEVRSEGLISRNRD